jgi:hypothetical protein
MRTAPFAMLLLAGALLAGCTTQNNLHEPPYPPIPAVPHETIPLPPVSEAPLIWQPGHWNWDGHNYLWEAGRWVTREGHGTLWQDGYWVEDHGGWVWKAPHWTGSPAPGTSVPAATSSG